MTKTIFVADDDLAILEVVTIILEDKGYTVVTTATGDGIVKKIQEAEPQLILLDIWMTGYDGGEITKMLRKHKSVSHIPIVIVSANNDTEKIAKAAGADGFLAKPFELEDLLGTVERYSL